MSIKLLQPIITSTGIRKVLDNQGREIATISSLLDGVDNDARAKEADLVHNEICERYNTSAALRAERDELREALDLLLGIGRKDHSNEKYDSIYENAIIVLEKYK